MTKPIFVSYARSESTEWVGALEEALGPERCFVDRRDIGVLAEFPAEIVRGLMEARVALVVLGPRYPLSWYCWREWLLALGPYQAALRRREDEARLQDAASGLVVALHPAVDPAALAMLPGPWDRQNLPQVSDVSSVVRAVAIALEATPLPLAERFETFGVDPRERDVLQAKSVLPKVPRRAAEVPTWPLRQHDRLASLHEGFIGRKDDFWRLHHALGPGSIDGAAALTATLVGGGGFGKTRLALEYFHRMGPLLYPGGNLWIDASGDAEGRSLEDQLAGADALLRTRRPNTPAAPSGADVRGSLAQALQHAGAHDPVLYVVDNLPDVGPLGRLEDYCPAAKEATVIITSRRTVRWPGVISVAIDTLPRAEAIKLLQRGLARPEDRLSAAQWDALADAVGDLPLVLEILNAALADTVESARDLHARITRELDPAAVAEELRDLVPERRLRGVSEAFRASLDGLENPQAKELLLRAAWLAPAPMPVDLLAALGGLDRPLPALARLLHRSWMPLAASAAPDPAERPRQIHRVVAAFLRGAQDDGESRLKTVAENLRDFVWDVADRPETDLETLAALQPHLQAAVTRSLERGASDPWKAAWKAQASWEEAVRQRAGGLPALFQDPSDLARNRRWWPLLEGQGLSDLLDSWRIARLETAAIESGLWSYLDAREDGRDAQAQTLQAFEALLAPGRPASPPRPPLEFPFYTRFFRRCGLPPPPRDPGALHAFVTCPPDGDELRFEMGSPEGGGYHDERPRHEVTLTSFCLGQTPVTWADYHCFDEHHRPMIQGNEAGDSHAVTEVSWWQAWLYCRWLGGDLPTEAQWEAACRAGTDTLWSFGPEADDLGDHGWYRENSDGRTHQISDRAANPWGFSDMHGNVWEWCRDWYGPYGEEAQRDPPGPPHGTERVRRGGCAWDVAGFCRSAERSKSHPKYRLGFIGFRVALPPPHPRASRLDH